MGFDVMHVDQEEPDKTYETCYVDADTILFRAAKRTQEDKIRVTYKPKGNYMLFKGVMEFRGLVNKKTGEFGGWLRDLNESRSSEGKRAFALDEFDIEPVADLKEPEDPNKTILEEAIEYIDRMVGLIKKHMDAKDYRLIIQDGINPRYEWATLLEYKGERKEKPILFSEIRELMLAKYRSKIIIANNKESDDEMSKIGWNNYLLYKKTGKWKDCLSYLDKDLNCIPSPSFNYTDVEKGFTIRDLEDGMRFFATQLISGDKQTDNIMGLPNITKAFAEKHGLKRSSGVGFSTAEKIIAKCENVKECFEEVCAAYKGYYGEEPIDVKLWRGGTSKMTWLNILDENARLLWMYRDDNMKFDIRDLLEEYNVQYRP